MEEQALVKIPSFAAIEAVTFCSKVFQILDGLGKAWRDICIVKSHGQFVADLCPMTEAELYTHFRASNSFCFQLVSRGYMPQGVCIDVDFLDKSINLFYHSLTSDHMSWFDITLVDFEEYYSVFGEEENRIQASLAELHASGSFTIVT